MFIKVCYGPLQTLTILDVKTVNFISNLQSDFYFVLKDEGAFIKYDENTACALPQNTSVYTNPEYLKYNKGCSSVGNTDDEVYLNTLYITRNDGEKLTIAHTGTAYLCNEQGKTVDTFR